ncbi:MAG: hypothetical protein BalsKO_18020 [Balneolaceae bacterium]
MDIKAYIDSGVLEQYVAGLLTDQENQEVDRFAELYPEIKLEIGAIRASINNYAQKTGRAPSKDILEASEKQIFENQTQSVRKTPSKKETLPPVKKKMDVFKVAASIVLLLSVGLNGFLFSELNTYKQESNRAYASVEKLNTQLDFISSAANMKVPLQGLGISPESHAAVYINKDTRDVYIQVGKLPVPPSGHQYQLWADRDGHMHNIGVFHHNTDIQHLAVFDGDFESLNVTLEVEGGSEVATVENAYLSGKRI